eukprot:COSAG01_NODE_32311_length_583_cov_1.008264_2_plen_70_part_00
MWSSPQPFWPPAAAAARLLFSPHSGELREGPRRRRPAAAASLCCMMAWATGSLTAASPEAAAAGVPDVR